MSPRLRPFVAMGPLVVGMVVYILLPPGSPREFAYPCVGVAAMVVAFAAVPRWGARGRRSLLLVLSGFAGWVLGDVVFLAEQQLFALEAYPAPSDVLYIAAYGLLGAGLVTLVRRRGERGDVAAVLDAAILATGVAVVAGVFVIAPVASDSSLSILGKLTSSLYPIGDVLLLGILVRLWTTPGARTAAFQLLAAALVMTLSADLLYNITTLTTGDVASLAVNDLLWMGSYVLVAGVAWSPRISELTEAAPGREDLVDPSKRMVVLTGGLLLPAVTLFADGITGGPVEWEVVAFGSMVLSVLVLARMAGLLTVVRTQAVQLSALARSDALTGAPNRRTWDHELSRACQAARETGSPLTVALLDLDHFKRYNDAHGHQAGDLLLREATAIWIERLEAGEILARYGGEEFAVLLPGRTADAARIRIEELLAVTPRGQTVSAGVATWDPDTEPAAVVAAADQALYVAKRSGRNRVSLDPTFSTVLPVPEIVLQPIVDMRTRVPVAVEALSRFKEGEPLVVFRRAWDAGMGPELEAAAIVAARRVRPRDMDMSVNVSLAALVTPPVRAALTGNLTGLILEVTEQTATEPTPELMEAVSDYRERGAVVAVDDWGTGFSNLDRLLLLRPEIVKIDMSLVHGLDSEYHRATIGAVSAWAETVGARVCAEGVELAHQWRELRTLGVHLGQGWFFGGPAQARLYGDPVSRPTETTTETTTNAPSDTASAPI